MKKVICILLLGLLLTSCSSRQDYTIVNIDDYSIAIGNDDVEYLKIAFSMDLPTTLQAQETIEDVDLYLFNERLGEISITNPKKKEIEIDQAIVSKATFYIQELEGKTIKINGEELSTSVKENCDAMEGEYIERNGYACAVTTKKNTIVLYGNIYNIDQDQLDRIEISSN